MESLLIYDGEAHEKLKELKILDATKTKKDLFKLH